MLRDTILDDDATNFDRSELSRKPTQFRFGALDGGGYRYRYRYRYGSGTERT